MKFCTLAKVREDGKTGDFIGCDAVTDNHDFGFTDDRTVCHVEGAHLPGDRIVMFGAVQGNMAALLWGPDYESTPCGHPEGTPEAACNETSLACPDDDGLTICRECGRTAPRDMFIPVVTGWKSAWWRQKVKITHFRCKEGCPES